MRDQWHKPACLPCIRLLLHLLYEDVTIYSLSVRVISAEFDAKHIQMIRQTQEGERDSVLSKPTLPSS